MLDLHRLQVQFKDFGAYRSLEETRMAVRLERALAALEACDGCWEELRALTEREKPGWLVPALRESPAAVYPRGTRPTPVTVVAADGSQIYPDRHVEPTCFLLNVSRIAFQYGTHEEPLMESVPAFRYRRDEVDELADEVAVDASSEVVSAFRDEQELEALLETARRARVEGRPIVALADGTLIRWMLRAMRNRALEERLLARYTRLLAEFHADRLPIASYISMPGNTEVVNLLRLHRGEHRAAELDEEASLVGLVDRRLFARTLAPGERSAVFESASHIQREYAPEIRIHYFYLHVPHPVAPEIARVEIPAWVADDGGLLDLVHAVVLSECEKGEGYPLILSEAHERAVIRAHERALFYELVERQLTTSGLPFTGSNKQASKRRPTV